MYIDQMIRRNPLATLRQGPAACARAAQAPARQRPAASSGRQWPARQGAARGRGLGRRRPLLQSSAAAP